MPREVTPASVFKSVDLVYLPGNRSRDWITPAFPLLDSAPLLLSLLLQEMAQLGTPSPAKAHASTFS